MAFFAVPYCTEVVIGMPHDLTLARRPHRSSSREVSTLRRGEQEENNTTGQVSRSAGGARRLIGKAAIVTGAARGIGRATAIAFAHEGADVMGIDIAGRISSTLEVVPADVEELSETGRMVSEAGARWCEAKLDQRNLPALRSAAQQAFQAFGRLDILFANAGIQSFKPILEWDDTDWHDQVDVNLTGTCNAIRAVAPYLVRNGDGRIIVTSRRPCRGRGASAIRCPAPRSRLQQRAKPYRAR
jgi:nucleoside-diphosphate-sugar epimerase